MDGDSSGASRCSGCAADDGSELRGQKGDRSLLSNEVAAPDRGRSARSDPVCGVSEPNACGSVWDAAARGRARLQLRAEGEGLFSEPLSQRGVSEDGARAGIEGQADGPLRVGADGADGRDGKAVGGADRAARKGDPSVPSDDKPRKECQRSNTENAEPAGELRMRIPDPSSESNDRADGYQVRKLRQSVRGWVRRAIKGRDRVG